MQLRAARESSGMTQAQVAKKVHIAERAYQNYEYGMREPGARTAICIAEVLGITKFKDFKKLFGAATPDNTKQPNSN